MGYDMPTVTFDKKAVLKYIGKAVPDEVLKDRISMIGTDLEKVDDKEIVVEIFPNRPDMLSEEGFSRAISAFMGIKPGFKKYDVKKSCYATTNSNPLPYWSYVVTAIVKGLDFNDEKIRQVIQLQEKLGVTLLRRRKKGGIGLYPLDKIKLPITFTSDAPEKIRYRPLEYPGVISGKEILEKHPTGREYAHICKGWEKLPYFVDAAGTIMSMPPIVNSHDVGKITEGTKDVFIEATGTDLNALKVALNIVVTALADMGGKIYSMEIIQGKEKFDTPDLIPSKMKLNRNYINKLLGLDISESDIKKLLAKMGLGFENNSALVPEYRVDILHPMDLVEDIAIAYGYENFKAEIPRVATIGEESRGAILKRKLAEVLVGIQFLECNTYHLSNETDLIEKMNAKKVTLVKAANAVNIEYTAMRNAILPVLMKILSENTRYEYPQRIFEAGTVFVEDTGAENGVLEKTTLAAVSAHLNADFSEIKAILDALFRAFDIKYEVKEKENPTYISGRCAEIIVAGQSVGFIGEIHPQVLNNWQIEMPVAAFEIDVDKVFGERVFINQN
ncbi:Phenylalanine--tRNA ligase beta subunit [uncultured archaeon]|nr:Phenylalanine--tRNA ligase beta subunit [uncultured archaeon]